MVSIGSGMILQLIKAENKVPAPTLIIWWMACASLTLLVRVTLPSTDSEFFLDKHTITFFFQS